MQRVQRRSRRSFSFLELGKEKEVSVLEKTPFEILVLPLVCLVKVRKGVLVAFAFLFILGEFVPPVIVVDHVQYVRGVRLRYCVIFWGQVLKRQILLFQDQSP